MTDVDAVVVGAGVVGLTTAISLAEAGLTTRVLSAEPAERTTSVAAGAIWGPVRCGPPERCYEWARTGLEVLGSLTADPSAGVRQLPGREVCRTVKSPPGWLDLLPQPQLLGPADLPAGFASGWAYTAPAVNMPIYLAYLTRRYQTAGGVIEIAEVPALASVDAPVVVNCTGIGARELVPDESVVPVRGQVVVVENPGITEFYLDHGEDGVDYVYLFPHSDVAVLGGTAEEGASDWAPRPEVSQRILRDCTAVFPQLRSARVVTERVGLRPVRPAVRLEAEHLPGGRELWHNYGHGGAGVTLSWGCASELTSGIVGQPGLPGRSGAEHQPLARDGEGTEGARDPDQRPQVTGQVGARGEAPRVPGVRAVPHSVARTGQQHQPGQQVDDELFPPGARVTHDDDEDDHRQRDR